MFSFQGEQDIDHDAISFEIVSHKDDHTGFDNIEFEITSNSGMEGNGDAEFQFEIPIDVSYDSAGITEAQGTSFSLNFLISQVY